MSINPTVIGVLHIPPLPGSPRAREPFESISRRVLDEASIFADAGMDALLLENHGDAPFGSGGVDPHVVAFMTVLSLRLRNEFAIPLGVNVLRNDAHAAVGIAAASGASFMRVNVLTGATATDQGIVEGCADSLMRYRQRLEANVEVWADVDVKFGTPLYRPTTKTLVSGMVGRALADAVIVTGEATGSPPALEELDEVRSCSGNARVYVGSGACEDSVAELLKHSDGVIVGSALKVDGEVESPVCEKRTRLFLAAARGS